MTALSSDNGTVVFIDTNLDTHLALTVSDHDTVSDFKKRIVLEHPLCFPKIGQIQINGIKVKRNGHFYHLSDLMMVKSAFRSYNKSWFLSVDVSALEDCRQYEQLFSHASLHRVDSIGVVNNALVRPSDDNAVILPCNYQLQMLENNQNEKEGEHVVSPCVSEYSAKKVDSNLKAVVDSSGHHDIEIPSPGSIPKMDGSGRLNNEVPSLHMECEVDGIDEGNKGDCNVYEDEPSVSVQSETIKQKKKRKREDTVEGDNSKEEIASDHPRVSEDTGKKAVKDLEMVQSLNIEEMVPSLNIECKAGELGEGNKDDCIRDEDVPSVTAPSAKRRKKSKKKKEDAAGDDTTKEETPFNRPHVSEHTEKEAVKNFEVVPSLHIECEVDGLGEENKGVAPSTSVPSEKKKGKSKRKNNKDTVGGSNSEINIGAVDNPVGCPSERASSFNIFQVPQSENKQDEKDEIPIDRPCISPLTEKKAVKDLEMVPYSHIECGIDGSNKGSKDESVVCEEGTSKPAPSAKKKKGKSKKKKEYAAEGDISNDNIASVDNPPGCPSERASNFNSFQTPQPKNKQDEKEEMPFDHPCVSQPTEKAVKNLEMVPNSHIVCDVDGSNKGGKDDSFVCEDGTSKPAPSAKKKTKNKKKKEDAAEGVISNDNIASVDNPPSCPSERASNFNSFQMPQPKSKQDEEEEIPFDRPSVSQPTEKEAVKNLEMVPNSHIECDGDGPSKGSKDESIVCEEGTSKPSLSSKKKRKNKSKRQIEDTVGGDISEDNIASVDNPPDRPSERVSNFNSFQVPQSNNKQDEKEEIPFDRSCVSQPTEKEAAGNLKMASNSHIECEVDGSNKGSKDDSIVCEDGTSKPAPSAKKKKTNRRKREETMQDDTMKENNASVVVPAEQDIAVLANSSENANKDSVVPAQQDIVVLANSSENANKEVIKETDALKEHQNTAGTDKNSKNDVNVLSTNEASELMSPAKKKSRKRKKPLAHESKDIIMSETNLDKMDIGTDACKESMQSTTKGAENYKNQTDIELEVQLSDANEPKDLIENNENVVVGHCNQSEVGQIDGAAAGEVSPQNVDMNGIKEPVKPVKEKKGIKNAKSKGGGKTLRKDNGHVDASESETVVTKSLNAAICDPMPGNTETKENPLNQTEGKVLQQEKMQGTVPSVTNKGDEFSTENIDSPEQTKTIPNAQNVDEHVSKKLKTISNNKQTSTPKGTSDMLTNGHALDSKRESVVNRIDKAPNAHKRGQVSKLSSPDSGMSSIGEYRKPPNNASGKSMDLEKQRKQIPTSNAKLGEGFNKMVQNKERKTSGNDAARVVSNSQQKKSLLDGAIFKDDSDSASEDEDKAYNSDASTRTPSDNSIPFDLDGYDSPDLNSQQNGSYDGKWLVNDERSSLKSSLSGTKKLPIEQILRSSARYKKAKITASQLDESETPPEFVPDSLA